MRVPIDYKNILPKKSLPIVIIGASGIVKDAHLPAYKKAGFNVYAIVNRTIEKAEVLAEQYGIPHVYSTVDEAVAHAPKDAVYDITIMPELFPEILNKLPNGSCALIQKPMGDNLAQAKEILKICKEKNITAAVNFQLRQAPYINAARFLIDQGYIGDLYDMEVKVTVETPWELFPIIMHHPRLEILYHSIHYIDLIRSFLGDPNRVYARSFNHPEKELSSSRTTIIMDYKDSLRAVINTNHDHHFGSENEESYIKWEGTKGAIKVQMGLLMNYPKGSVDKFQYCLKNEQGNYTWREETIEGTWFPDAFIGSMGSLMRYKLGETDFLPASVEDVLGTMIVVDKAYESSDKGGEVVSPK